MRTIYFNGVQYVQLLEELLSMNTTDPCPKEFSACLTSEVIRHHLTPDVFSSHFLYHYHHNDMASAKY